MERLRQRRRWSLIGLGRKLAMDDWGAGVRQVKKMGETRGKSRLINGDNYGKVVINAIIVGGMIHGK